MAGRVASIQLQNGSFTLPHDASPLCVQGTAPGTGKQRVTAFVQQLFDTSSPHGSLQVGQQYGVQLDTITTAFGLTNASPPDDPPDFTSFAFAASGSQGSPVGSLEIIWWSPTQAATLLVDDTNTQVAWNSNDYEGPVIVLGWGGGGGGGSFYLATHVNGGGGGGGSIFQNALFIAQRNMSYALVQGTGGTSAPGLPGGNTEVLLGAVALVSLVGGTTGSNASATAGGLGGSDGIDSVYARGGTGSFGSGFPLPSMGGYNTFGPYAPSDIFDEGGGGGAGIYDDINDGQLYGAGGSGEGSKGALDGSPGFLQLTWFPNSNVAWKQFTRTGVWTCPQDVSLALACCVTVAGQMACQWTHVAPGQSYPVTIGATGSFNDVSWPGSLGAAITLVWFQ